MRNLIEYPITEEEILACLKRHAEVVITSETTGGMDAMLLTAAIDIVKCAGDMLRGIEKRFDTESSSLRYVTPWKEAAALVEAMRGNH